MAITSLEIYVDKLEYSQYEESNKTVTIIVYPTPTAGLTGDEITVDIIKSRRDKDSSIYSVDFTFDGADYTDGKEFSVQLDDVRSSTDLFRLARRGKYLARVTHTPVVGSDITADSDDFYVSIVTVDRLKNMHLSGINLMAYEIRMPLLPLRSITGVNIVRSSVNHPTSFFDLGLRVSSTGNKYLTWGVGKETKIDLTLKSTARYVLRGGSEQSDYIVVDVNARKLPASSISEEVLIEGKTLDDEYIRSFVSSAADFIELTALQVFLEPTRVVTDVDPTHIIYTPSITNPILVDYDYDFIGATVDFYPKSGGQWYSMKFPYPWILSIDSLFGVMANTRVLDVNPEWVEFDEPSGFVRLVPYNQEQVFDFAGLVWVESIRGLTTLPGFWHYSALVGLRDISSDLQEYVAKVAAIQILNIAGQAYMGGIASQSISQDGLSESVSYTRGATAGTFAALTSQYERWIAENLPRFRRRYRGISVGVM